MTTPLAQLASELLPGNTRLLWTGDYHDRRKPGKSQTRSIYQEQINYVTINTTLLFSGGEENQTLFDHQILSE
jgi:hypothetical protein